MVYPSKNVSKYGVNRNIYNYSLKNSYYKNILNSFLDIYYWHVDYSNGESLQEIRTIYKMTTGEISISRYINNKKYESLSNSQISVEPVIFNYESDNYNRVLDMTRNTSFYRTWTEKNENTPDVQVHIDIRTGIVVRVLNGEILTTFKLPVDYIVPTFISMDSMLDTNFNNDIEFVDVTDELVDTNRKRTKYDPSYNDK
jgi:hypothetical protein